MSDFPYPGLRPYERDETDIFFGREEHIDQLIKQLKNAHFLAVVGPSGCGKSSLVRTGLLAALETGFMASAGGSWRMAELRPGNRPFRRLAETFVENKVLDDTDDAINSSESVSLLQPSFRRGPKSLHELLENRPLPENTTLLLLVDQFEEIFRYYQQGDKNEAAAFIKLLLASSTHPAVYVILTMRSDFIGDCATFYGLPEAISQGLFLTPRLTRDQLSEAIELPAAVFGDEVEPALTNRLLNEVGPDPDKLPQLQHALMRMWRLAHTENPEKATLSLTHYKKIGGLENALSQHADVAYASLDSTQQKIAEHLFRSLTERSNLHRDTRRPVRLTAVATLANVSWKEVVNVVEVFRREGRSFLTPPLGKALEPKTILDISHESLIRQWKRLKQWTKDETKSADTYRRLETTALLKEAGKAELWKGLDLANALYWYHKEKPTQIWARRYGKEKGKHFELAEQFLTQSEKEQEREEQEKEVARKHELQKMRQTAAFIGVGLFVSILLTVMVAWLGLEASKSKMAAQQSRSLLLTELARQETARSNATNGILLALEALPKEMSHKNTPYIPKAEETLYEAVIKLRERAVMQWHEYSIYHVAFSPDGQRIVTASGDKTVGVWDVESGELLQVLKGHKKTVVHADFSPDGQYIVTASMDNTARLWEVSSGKQLKVLKGHREGVFHATFNPDSQRVVTVGGEGNIRLWDVSSGKYLKELKGHENSVFYAAFSPDGQKLVTTSMDKTARLWEVSSGKPLNVLKGHKNSVYHAAFSPDGQRVVTASFDNTARLWDVKSGQRLNILEGHEQGVSSVAFSPDGRRIVTASWDGTARLWDANSGKPFKVLKGHLDKIFFATFSANNQYVITTSEDKTARLWEASSGKLINVFKGHEQSIFHAAFSPNSQRVVTASMDNTARLWDVSGEQLIKELKGHDKRVSHADFSSDGQYVVTASEDKTACLWEMSSGKRLKVLKGHEEAVRSAVFSPDSQRLITTSKDNTARLWEIPSGQVLNILEGHKKAVKNAAFSPNGRYVVTASEDKTARLWEVSSGKVLNVLEGHEEAINSVVFSPDGQYIITASEDKTARLWETSRGKSLHILKGHEKRIVHAAFSPDGQSVITASSDKTARIWRVIDGTLIRELKGHEKGLSNAVFSPNGQFILTASWDRTARLWKVDSDTPSNMLKGHQRGISYAAFSPNGKNVITTGEVARLWDVSTGKVRGVLEENADGFNMYATFSPDGRHVLTVSTGKTVRLWPVFSTTQEIIDYAKKRVPRCLSIEQRRQFSLPETKSQILVSEGEELARTDHIDSAAVQFEKALLLDSQYSQKSCFKFEPKNRAERIADQAKLAEFATGLASNLDPRRTHQLPFWCENKLDKAEKVICENPLLWDIEKTNYETYYELYDSFNSEVQDQFNTEKTIWLYKIRNPQCEQSVKFCLQVYEERIKVLNQYQALGNQ